MPPLTIIDYWRRLKSRIGRTSVSIGCARRSAWGSLLACPRHRTEPMLADGDIIDPNRKTFVRGGLIICKTDRQCLKCGGNFDAFKVARTLVLADVRDFLAVDKKLVCLGRGIGVPFEQSPFVGIFLHCRGLGAEFLPPVRRLDVIEIVEIAGGIKQQGGQAHIDQIIGERADASAIDQGGMNKPPRRHRRRRLYLVVKPAPMLTAERRDLVGGEADEASAFYSGLNLQGMLAAVGHAFFDADVAVLVKPVGIAPTGVDSKSSDRMRPCEGRLARLLAAQPDTTILSTAAANEIFMESPRSQLNDEPIGSA